MKLTFRSRILVTIALSCLICTSAAILVARGRLQDNGELAVLAKSRAILSRLEVGRDYVAEMGMLDQVIADTVKRHPNGVLTEDDKLRVLKNVPVFAAFKLGQAAAEREHYKFRIASDKPRREENRATPDELRVIDKFKADPQLTEWVESSPDGATISVVRPVRISERQGCLVCHGHPSRSPWENGKDILGYPMENMKDGDLRATFAVVSETAPIRAVVQAATGNIILWGLIFTAVALGIGFLAIRRSLGDLNAVSDRLGVSGVELSNVSSQISSVSQSLSASSTESAASLEQTVSSIEEISSMINRNADSAREAAGLSKAARAAAEKGEVEIKELNSAIREISTSSSKIEEIINVIDDIAFQTNLLALNAAVEAARAGEQGKGFAVVAEAVRNLAQRSAAAAKDITSLIKDSVGKVERGSDLATSSGQALAAIVASVQKMAEITSEIASASTEQAAGINQISKAMNQLDQTTQQNAAASEESAASAEQMAIQASSLQELVKDLTAVIDGVTLEESRAQHSRSVPAQDGLSWSPSATLGRPGEVFPETAMHEPPRKAPVSKAVPPSRNPETAKTGGKKILSSTEDINKDF